VFIIDPNQIIRTILYYPLTTGRNMDEILRIIDALQTTDKHNVSTPANWRPGDKVVVPPPNTQEMAEERLKEGYECVDWYLCKKKLYVYHYRRIIWHVLALMVSLPSQVPRCSVPYREARNLLKKLPRRLGCHCSESEAGSVSSLRLDWLTKKKINTSYRPRGLDC
jgi:hypothetical protein